MDAGRSWTRAELVAPVLPQCLTRFRLPWQWDGKPAVLQSRSTDERGNVQPPRAAWKTPFSNVQFYHYNAIQSWGIDSDNSVKNVYV